MNSRINIIVCTFLISFLFTSCGGGGGGDSSSNNDSPNTTGSGGNDYPTSVTISGNATDENTSNYHIKVQGLNRDFSFFRPSNPERKKLPIVIDFHGASGIVAPGFAIDPWVAIARREQFFLLKPQAVSDAYVSYTYWNVGWDVGRDDIFFVKTLLDSIVNQQDIDIDRIYVTGMSSGGHMAFYTAQALRDQIAAVASISGTILNSQLSKFNFNKAVPLCKIHGDADTIVSLNGDSSSAAWSSILPIWLNNNKISNPPVITQLPDINKNDNSTVTKYEYRGATIASDIDFYLINNGNHSIPGIESSANQDINAYEIIWAFFKKHKLSDPY